jgi:tetratricopeptide (TPR) repeat protein
MKRINLQIKLVSLVVLTMLAGPTFGATSDADLALIERQVVNKKSDAATIARLEKLLAAEPENAYAHLLLSECLKQEGYFDLADEQMKLAQKYNQVPAESLRYLKLKIHRGDLPDAYKMLEIVRKRYPNDPSVKLLDALKFEMGGKSPYARQQYKALVESRDRPLGAASALAGHLLDDKSYFAAAALAQLDLDISPNYAAANLIRGQALLAMHREAQAIIPLQRAFEDQPLHPDTAWPLAQCYLKLNKNDKALEPLLFAMARSKNDSELYPRLNATKQVIRVLPKPFVEKTIQDASTVINRTPYSAYFHTAVGTTFDRLNRRNEAFVQYLQAVTADKNFVPALYRLGRSMERVKKDYATAKDLYTRAYMLDPKYRLNLAALDRLQMRVYNRDNDLAWQLKDLFNGNKSRLPEPETETPLPILDMTSKH